MTHVTCRQTAKYRDQLQNPTLGNRVWATFFLDLEIAVYVLRFRLKTAGGGYLAKLASVYLPQAKNGAF